MLVRYFRLLMVLLIGLPGAVVANSRLADAVENRDGELIGALLAKGANVNAPQVDGMTALHWSVYHDDVAIAQLLVGAGADANVANRYGVGPLSLACSNGNPVIVELLLDAGANADAALRGGETVLMTASRVGNLATVQALLAAGADPNKQEKKGQTAMMWAAAEGHTSAVQALMKAEGDFRASLDSGFTPMFFAVREGHTNVVHALLAAGIDVNEPLRSAKPGYRMAKDGTSPLMMAVTNGHFELAIGLVAAGADPNDERIGLTPLHLLTRVRKADVSDVGDPVPQGSGNIGSLQFARAMVEAGADINARLGGRDGCVGRLACGKMRGATPFLMASDRADAPYMRLLLELGADPFLPNSENTTPLMAAAGLGTGAPLEEAGTEAEALEVVNILLSLGADVDAVNDQGETVMHGAAYGSFPSIVHVLADHDANSSIWRNENNHGWTPLFIAEGYRPGNFKPAPATIEALHKVMLAEGIPISGPRPRHIGGYEQARLAAEAKAKNP